MNTEITYPNIHYLLENHPLPANFQEKIYELNLLVWDDG